MLLQVVISIPTLFFRLRCRHKSTNSSCKPPRWKTSASASLGGMVHALVSSRPTHPRELGARSGKLRASTRRIHVPAPQSLWCIPISPSICYSICYLDAFRTRFLLFSCIQIYVINDLAELTLCGDKPEIGPNAQEKFNVVLKKDKSIGPGRELNPGPPPYSARRRNHATRPSGLIGPDRELNPGPPPTCIPKKESYY
jgi:hypothetical protein